MFNTEREGAIGIVAGSFDLLHPGYLRLLREASRNCDHLIVALHSDPSVERSKKNRPIVPLAHRFLALTELACVNEVVPYETEDELVWILETVQPHVRFLGDDYAGRSDFTGSGLVEIHWVDRSHGWSMTKLRKEIACQT